MGTQIVQRKTTGVVLFLLTIFLVLVFYYTGQESVFTAESSPKNRLLARLQKERKHEDEIRDEVIGEPDGRVHTDSISDDEFMDNIADDDFMNMQAEIQRQRKLTIRKACAKYQPSLPRGPYKVATPHRFIINKEYRLGYCSVAKVASTNWRLVFETLAGVVQLGEATNQRDINRKLKKELSFMDDFQPYDVNKLMRKSLTFMFARHPFSRVLSSFRNKLDPESTFERALPWQRKLGENVIMTRYRGPEFQTSKTAEEFARKYNLTFTEFVRFLGDPETQDGHFSRNIHWAELYKLCTPCNMDYDVIGKLETLNDDVKYIFKLANLEDKVQFPSAKISSPTYSYKNSTLESYFKKVPEEFISKLYSRYKFDFELFGYEPPLIAVGKTDERDNI